MKKHTKVYFDYFGYVGDDFIPCETCGAKSVDINHIICKGMGGVKNNKMDVIENLQAVCRLCHVKYGDNKKWLSFLVEKHAETIGCSFSELMKKINLL